MNMFMGIKIIESSLATEEVYNFQISKNRSRRLHKKLLKRYGTQSLRHPGAYMMGGKIIAHPEIIKKLVDNTYAGFLL
jgi:hypothetical protein